MENPLQNSGSLDKIVSRYDLVLFDTSAILGFNRRREQDLSFKDRMDLAESAFENSRYLLSYAEKGLISLVPGVIEEINANNGHNVKKKMRERQSRRERIFRDSEREYLELVRAKQKSLKPARKLVEAVELKQKVIQLNQEESLLYEQLGFNFKQLREKYSLSEVDFSILISGLVLSYKRGSTAIISNDFNLLDSGRKIAAESKMDWDKFGFFVRKKMSSFISASHVLSRFY